MLAADGFLPYLLTWLQYGIFFFLDSPIALSKCSMCWPCKPRILFEYSKVLSYGPTVFS